jgi:hypothetical protein
MQQEYMTWIAFDALRNLPADLKASNQVDARLQVYHEYGYGQNEHPIYLGQGAWQERDFTLAPWVSRPGVGQYMSTERSLGNGWYEWNVTTYIQTYKNAPFMTVPGMFIYNPQATNYNRFYSSDYLGDSTLLPKLVITYVPG